MSIDRCPESKDGNHIYHNEVLYWQCVFCGKVKTFLPVTGE